MKEFKIYTAGKMSGLRYTAQMAWRQEMEDLIKDRTDRKVTFIHPPAFYRYDEEKHKNEREVKEWDINQLMDSDIVIVNLDGISDSIGTHFELGIVDAINSVAGKHIYVVGIGEPNKPLHPWIELSLHRYEKKYENAADFIAKYLLV